MELKEQIYWFKVQFKVNYSAKVGSLKYKLEYVEIGKLVVQVWHVLSYRLTLLDVVLGLLRKIRVGHEHVSVDIQSHHEVEVPIEPSKSVYNAGQELTERICVFWKAANDEIYHFLL